jgi:hypothetical protein
LPREVSSLGTQDTSGGFADQGNVRAEGGYVLVRDEATWFGMIVAGVTERRRLVDRSPGETIVSLSG